MNERTQTGWRTQPSNYGTRIDTLETGRLHVEIQHVDAGPTPRRHLVDVSLICEAAEDKKKNVPILKFGCDTQNMDETRRMALARTYDYMETVRDEIRQMLVRTITGKDVSGTNADEP